MTQISKVDLDEAIKAVLQDLSGISSLYPTQYEILSSLLQHDNVFFTSSTNSGKTLPAVIFPSILSKLSSLGYNFPSNPKLLFITALNSLKLSLVNNVKALGIDCEAMTSENVDALLDSTTSVIFISPEVLKQSAVTQTLLLHRSKFVLKVVDEAHLGKNYSDSRNSRKRALHNIPFLVVNWGLKKGNKRAFRPAMALSTGELSGLGGKLLLMTATATKKTMRVLQDQFPEVSKWKMILNIPDRSNVTILVPPPHLIPTNPETTLAPFVRDMKEKNKTYLILVRGK